LRRRRTASLVTAWLALGAATATAAPAGGAAADAQVAAAAADPDAPTVTAKAERTEAHVGDPIPVTITAIAKAGVPVNLPAALSLAPFTLLDRKAETEKALGDGRIRREFTLSVAAYEPGTPELPPIEVTYLAAGGAVRTVATAPVPIKIASLIANEPEPALKDAAAPVTVMEPRLWPAYLAGALVAAALGAVVAALIVRRMRARRGERPGPPPRPAHEVALERLDRLGALGFLENADNRPFYFAISEVMRDYLGGRYGFDSLELTTDELVAELRARSHEVTLGEIQGWLTACDLVKFAKISPTAAEARGALESAIRIVTTTRPVPAPVVVGAGGGEARHA
jgi:hypothetical protein